MILRTRCPSCGASYRLQPPFPAEGKKYRCTCGTVITITYPDEVKQALSQPMPAVPADAPVTASPLPAVPDAVVPQTRPSAAQPSAPASEPLAGPAQAAPPAPPVPAPAPPPAAAAAPPTRPAATPAPVAPPAPMPPPRAAAAQPPPPRPAPAPMPAARPTPAREPRAPSRPLLPGANVAAAGPPAGFTAPPSIPPLDTASRRRAPGLDGPVSIRSEPLANRAAGRPGLTSPDSLRQAPPLDSTRRVPAAPPAPAAPPEPPQAAEPTEPAVSDRPASSPLPSPKRDAAPKARKPRKPRKAGAKKAKGTPAAKKPARRGFFSRWYVKWPLLAILLGAIAGAVGLFALITHYGKDLPSVDSLAVYEPPTVTTLVDANGEFVGEFYEEQRYPTALDEIPKEVQNAFVSAEDAAFWDHNGLDFMGIARAALKNVQEQRMAQGASTITQQVARSFLLSREKKLERKLKEAILSTRVEKNFPKEHILYLYLNQIYLGHGAYGVEAASRLYWGKSVREIGLAEAAILAGLPQAPHTYSPNRSFEKAKARQRYVLDQMVRRGYATQEEADAAFAQEMTFVKKHDRNLVKAPYYVEHVRRYLVEKYGHDAVYKQGLQVTLPLDLGLQKVANEAVAKGVRSSDKRMGYRGPIAQHPEPAAKAKVLDAIDRERTIANRVYHPSFELPEGPLRADLVPGLVEGELTRGVVRQVDAKWALVDVGQKTGLMPVSEWSWCHNIKPESNWKFFQCRTMDDMLAVGDEIAIRVVNETETWGKTLPKDWAGESEFPRIAMEQDPAPEAALMSMRVTDGAILAMVGGTDFEETEFNRAIQAKRQVGSTFKPLVFAAALDSKDHNFTPSSILVDAPIVEQLSGKKGELWKPGNSGGEYLGDTTLRRGLVLSRNIVTLKLMQAMGADAVLKYMARFGFDTALEPNIGMGLGTSSLTMHEMLRAYTVFPTLGDRREPYFISEVKDRHGNVLESTTAGELTEDVMDEETAFVMVNLMQDVVRAGTARAALELKVPLAGKTGTTNGYRDAWFVGYTPELITSAWVGMDDFTQLGKGQYGGEIALPIWIHYMKAALEQYPPSEYEKPRQVTFERIDSKSGKLAREGETGTKVAFKKGTEPTEYAPSAGQVDAADFLSGDF